MGVLRGYISLLDEETLGNEFVSLISIRFVQGKWKEVIGEISKLSHVRAIYDVTGEMDLVCICYFKDRNELDEFLKNQLQLPCVERVLTNIVLNVYEDERRTLLPAV